MQKARLTSRLHFFQLIFCYIFFDGVVCQWSKSCFEWRGFVYEGGTKIVGG